MLLFEAKRGGEAGDRDLRRCISLSDDGDWSSLLQEACNSVGPRLRRQTHHSEEDRLAQAFALVQEGELNHAARTLQSLDFTIGSD